jgi:hypothetical protein
MQATHQVPATTTPTPQTNGAEIAKVELSVAQLALVGGGTGGIALF